mmetsp:Transcript_112531/g.251169  ORF Transcript_112531/g.251169 Transcript_112531/m.251169 type:complete len:223 (-) Transcript_112531:308-976(-)
MMCCAARPTLLVWRGDLPRAAATVLWSSWVLAPPLRPASLTSARPRAYGPSPPTASSSLPLASPLSLRLSGARLRNSSTTEHPRRCTSSSLASLRRASCSESTPRMWTASRSPVVCHVSSLWSATGAPHGASAPRLAADPEQGRAWPRSRVIWQLRARLGERRGAEPAALSCGPTSSSSASRCPPSSIASRARTCLHATCSSWLARRSVSIQLPVWCSALGR